MKTNKPIRPTAHGLCAPMKVSLLLLVVMMLVPQGAWAEPAGSGTSASPYMLHTFADLEYFIESITTKNVFTTCAVLYDDIEVPDSYAWPTALGSERYPYTGYFDGQGHTISGIKITGTDQNKALGFFAYTNEKAYIRRLKLRGTISSSCDNTGSIVGWAKGDTKIEDVTSYIDITINGEKKTHLGGIAGTIEGSTTLAGCTYSGTLNAGSSTDSNGGIVGFANSSCSGSIKNCFFDGQLTTTGSGPQMGGILGYTNDQDNNFGGVQGCYSCGQLSFSGDDKYANGIIGRIRAHSKTTMNNTFLSGTAARACNADCAEKVDVTTNKAISITLNSTSAGGSIAQSYVNPTTSTSTQLCVEAKPDEGYHYTGWNDQGARKHNIGLTGNISLQTSFEKHSYGEWRNDNQPNCNTTGRESRKCSVCSDIEYHILPMLGHDMTEHAEIAATCTSDGCKAYWTCSRSCCQNKYYENSKGGATFAGIPTISSLGHDYSKKNTNTTYRKTPATCTADAVYYYKCSRCDSKGSKTWTQTDSKLGHDYTSQTATETYLSTPATCTADAVYFHKCSRCNAKGSSTWTQTGTKLGHDYSSQTATETYLLTPATCTADAVYYHKCSRCDAKGETTWTKTGSKFGHDYTSESEDEAYLLSPATCTADAVYYHKCSHCAEMGETTWTKGGSKFGHDFSYPSEDEAYLLSPATCTANAVYYFKCTRCPEKGEIMWTQQDSALGHQLDENKDCTRCGQKAAEIIALRSTNGTCLWTIYEDGHMIIQPLGGPTGMLERWDEAPWYQYREKITSVEFLGEIKPETCKGMFKDCINLTSIDFGNIKLYQTDDFENMFDGCKSLQELDLSCFILYTSQNFFYRMFYGCQNLTTLKLNGTIKTNRNSDSMFERCGSSENPCKVYYVIDPDVKEDFTRSGGNHLVFVESAIVLDNVSFNCPVELEFPAENVALARKFTPQKPATIMLPFTVDAGQISDATFYEFKGVKYVDNEWVLDLQEVSDTVQAYMPYVVIPTATNITFGTGSQIVTFPNSIDCDPRPTIDCGNGWTFAAGFSDYVNNSEVGKYYCLAGEEINYPDHQIHVGEFVKCVYNFHLNPSRCYFIKKDGLPLTDGDQTGRYDLNHDGQVNVADLVLLTDILGGQAEGSTDTDLTEADVDLLRQMILSAQGTLQPATEPYLYGGPTN